MCVLDFNSCTLSNTPHKCIRIIVAQVNMIVDFVMLIKILADCNSMSVA